MFDREGRKEAWRDGVYLTTADNSFEADILESKLNAEGIPAIRRYGGAGNAMEIIMGTSITSAIDLYVPEATLEDARNIIVQQPLDDEGDYGDDDPEKQDK